MKGRRLKIQRGKKSEFDAEKSGLEIKGEKLRMSLALYPPLHSAVFPRHSGRTPRHVRLIASLFHYPAHCLFLLTFPFPLRRKDEGEKIAARRNEFLRRAQCLDTHSNTRALPPTPSLTCAHAAACSRARANPQEVFKCVRQKYARIVAHWTAALSERKEGRTEGRRE